MSDTPTPADAAAAAAVALSALNDVTCAVDIVMGSSAFTVRECLDLKANTIIRLHEFAGADMQVVVNGVPVATGEVVVMDDSTSIRVTGVLPTPSNEAPE